MASARLRGNLLFKASKYKEACYAYSEGLEHEAYNSVLLCNRAACRSKLGQYEKAVEDCTAALIVMPSYSKARLRRADCNAKVNCRCYYYMKFLWSNTVAYGVSCLMSLVGKIRSCDSRLRDVDQRNSRKWGSGEGIVWGSSAAQKATWRRCQGHEIRFKLGFRL